MILHNHLYTSLNIEFALYHSCSLSCDSDSAIFQTHLRYPLYRQVCTPVLVQQRQPVFFFFSISVVLTSNVGQAVLVLFVVFGSLLVSCTTSDTQVILETLALCASSCLSGANQHLVDESNNTAPDGIGARCSSQGDLGRELLWRDCVTVQIPTGSRCRASK